MLLAYSLTLVALKYPDLTAWEVLEKIKFLAKGDEALQSRLLSSRVRVIKWVLPPFLD